MMRRISAVRPLQWGIFILCLQIVFPVSGQNFKPIWAIDKEITLDFEKVNGFMLIKIRYNNMLPLKFIFDTGSENTILFKKEYADLLGTQFDRKVPIYGADLSRPVFAYIARNVMINIDNALLTHCDLLVLEENYLALESVIGERVDGILGANIFKFFVVTVDNRSNKISFIQRKLFKPPKKNTKIDIELINAKPYVKAQVKLDQGKEVPVNLLFDTGAALPLLLFQETDSSLVLPEETIPGNLGIGLGGFIEGYIGRIAAFQLNDEIVLPQFVTHFQDLPSDTARNITQNRNGIIGNGFLNNLNYSIDYVNEEFLYKTNKRLAEKRFPIDRSGMRVVAAGLGLKEFVIQKVLPNSPAEDAGLQKGDLIEKVSWVPAKYLTLDWLNHKLSRKEGKTIKITINRNGTIMKKKFKLKNLI